MHAFHQYEHSNYENNLPVFIKKMFLCTENTTSNAILIRLTMGQDI